MQNPLIYFMLIGIFLNQSILPLDSKSQETSNTNPVQIYFPIVSQKTCKICYFIDSNNGLDSNTGSQPDQPWKTFNNLDTDNLQPGTTVYLKRGSIWTGRLYIYASGTANNPITFTAYGSGVAPILSNPADTNNRQSLLNLWGNYIIIDNIKVQESGKGINIFSDHNTIQNSEITNTGIGISVSGQYNLITHNYIHDLHMVLNTPNVNGDDFGAHGVDISDTHNEVSFNRFENCEAFSYDYGINGKAVEIYQIGDYTSIHHNWSFQSSGFMEVSSDGTGSATNVTIFDNVIINATMFTVIHVSDHHATQIWNFRVENNTVVDLRAHDPLWGNYIGFIGTPSPDAYIMRNNIFYISDYYRLSSTDQLLHQNNIYYFLNPKTILGFTLDQSEVIADPQFIDRNNLNFHLLPTSPAINEGLNLGYKVDFDLNPVPIGNFPDLGAFESQGN